MSSPSLTIEQFLTLLAETPTRITALTAALSPEALQFKLPPHEWSINEVLAHLRACADIWGTYIKRIIAEDHPSWNAVSPRTWIRQTDYPELAFSPSLRAFTAQRAELLAVLSPLSSEAWTRSAQVSMVGKTIERTVLSYVERMAIHERSHLKQITYIVNTMHAKKGSKDS